MPLLDLSTDYAADAPVSEASGCKRARQRLHQPIAERGDYNREAKLRDKDEEACKRRFAFLQASSCCSPYVRRNWLSPASVVSGLK